MIKWLAIPLIFFVFAAGCSESIPAPGQVVEEREVPALCDQPYFEYKAGECCLDENSDQVCDIEEIVKVPEEAKVEIADTCTVTNSFDCSNINIQDDKIYGGFISFDLTFKKYGAAVITNIDFPELGCSYEKKQWSIDDGVRQAPTSFYIRCPFSGNIVSKGVAESDMVISFVHYDEVRQGAESAWTGVYDIKKVTTTGHVAGSI